MCIVVLLFELGLYRGLVNDFFRRRNSRNELVMSYH